MTAPRFLIDENLSPALVEPARRHGFEAMHVNYLGLRTETDWDLLKVTPPVALLAAGRRRPDKAALDYIGTHGDMVNRAVDVAFDLNRVAVVTAYDLP